MLFESYDRRINQINKVLNDNGIASLEEAKSICEAKGVDVYNIVKESNQFALKMRVGHILLAVLLQLSVA